MKIIFQSSQYDAGGDIVAGYELEGDMGKIPPTNDDKTYGKATIVNAIWRK